MSYDYLYYKNLNNTERDYYEKGEFRPKDGERLVWASAVDAFKNLCKNELHTLNLKLDENSSRIRYFYPDPDDVAMLRLVYRTDSYSFMLFFMLEINFDSFNTCHPLFSFYYGDSPIVINVGSYKEFIKKIEEWIND